MKSILILLAAATLALKADNPPTPAAPTAPPAPVDDATASHQGYPAARYESLWTKSPFAVETPDEVVQESVDYTLVGVAQIDGVSFASLIETKNQDHRLVRSDNATPDGLLVKSITKRNGDTYAVVNRNGEALTLKLQTATEGTPPGNAVNINAPAVPMPGAFTQNIPMPGSSGAPGSSPSIRPLIRIHRPVIHVPQRTDTPPPPAGATPGQPPPPPPVNR
jgi:hypothetical protein